MSEKESSTIINNAIGTREAVKNKLVHCVRKIKNNTRKQEKPKKIAFLFSGTTMTYGLVISCLSDLIFSIKTTKNIPVNKEERKVTITTTVLFGPTLE